MGPDMMSVSDHKPTEGRRMRKLKEVGLRETRVTEAGVKSLRKALPEALIYR